MSFAASHPTLIRALTERGYRDPTPVQAAVLQPETANRDLLVSAQTGSGKTIAYGLTIASTVLGAAERFRPGGQPLALIAASSRELSRAPKPLTAVSSSPGGRQLPIFAQASRVKPGPGQTI
jgi:ATP-dependent RNA helicase DeaD